MAGAVGRGIVLAEHRDMFAQAQGHLEDQGNEMAFRPVVLADGSAGSAPATLK